MATLAIKGHPTRGKEIIEILKMLGGKNPMGWSGSIQGVFYFVDVDEDINVIIDTSKNLYKYELYTLEGFFKEFPYKVGDKVVVSERGIVVEITGMSWRNGREIIYETLFKDDCYECFSADELQPYKEQESMEEQTYLNPKVNKEIEEIKENLTKLKEIMKGTIKMDSAEMGGERFIVPIPKGYEFVGVDDDNQQVVLEKIKPQYPKTYDECCVVLGTDCENLCLGYAEELLDNLQSLLICRDAYWKLAGDELGLGKPWKPDWNDLNPPVHCVVIGDNGLRRLSHILAFPTEEMRDAFYENFKSLIEQCKELL